MKLIDTHAHLFMLEHDPLEKILERSRAAGVDKLITVSTDEKNWSDNQRISEAHENIFFTLGMHPHDTSRWQECAAELSRLLTPGKVHKKCVAVGELGLDYHYNRSPQDVQRDVLEAQVLLAKAVNLPIVIHCRDAFEDLYNLLRKVGLPARGGVMHCFTGGKKDLKGALDLGLHISFSGILTFKTAAELREASKDVPKDCLLIETDCPFLAPIPHRGKPNEPAYLPMTAHCLATARGESVANVAGLTHENAVKFFQI